MGIRKCILVIFVITVVVVGLHRVYTLKYFNQTEQNRYTYCICSQIAFVYRFIHTSFTSHLKNEYVADNRVEEAATSPLH